MKLKRNSPMSEVPREENGEIELNLGLSLCGSFGKPAKSNSSDTPLFQKQVRDRGTTIEEEGEIGERRRKRERIEDGMDPIVLTLSRDASPLPSTIPVVPQAYSCLPLHYPNAVPYSCVVPCWAPLSGPETSMIPPAGCRSFQPYQGNSGHNVVSDGSPAHSSPAFSDNGSISQQGGSSSDTGSLSNHSKHEQSAHCETRENLGGVSSNHIKKDSSNSPNSKEKVTLPGGILESNPTRLDEQTNPQIQEDPAVTSQVPVSGPLRLASQDLGKPPKPDQVRMPDNQSQNMPKFSQMPCVSTTGNGPNGKTVTGFLYRYTKSEVSIICVCHGTSFSPAEFVEHAGGTDVSHPLKHITVIPSAF